MSKKRTYKLSQIILIITIIVLLFIYIIADIVSIKPKLNKKVNIIIENYDSLNLYVYKNVQLMDTHLIEQTTNLKEQTSALKDLKLIVEDKDN